MTRAISTARLPRPRRTQEQRRQQTQTSILDAAIEVLLEQGFAGMSTVEVAARAGVSRGALAHYYRTREDLILAATRHLMDRGTHQTFAAAERARESTDPIEHFIADAERFFFDPIYVGMIELLIASRTNPAFRQAFVPIVEDWRTQVNDTWLELLSKAGIPADRAKLMLHFTNHVMRGMALTSLWNDDVEERRALLAGWRDLIRSMPRGTNPVV